MRRDATMAIEPSRALSWEPLTDTDGWRFVLRQGVRFHDGATFDADAIDTVLMSDMAEPASQLISRGLSGYSEARDARLSTNPDAARALLDEAAAILQDEVAYVPLYVEPLLWAARDTIDLVQRPDNFVLLR